MCPALRQLTELTEKDFIQYEVAGMPLHWKVFNVLHLQDVTAWRLSLSSLLTQRQQYQGIRKVCTSLVNLGEVLGESVIYGCSFVERAGCRKASFRCPWVSMPIRMLRPEANPTQTFDQPCAILATMMFAVMLAKHCTTRGEKSQKIPLT